VCPREEKTFRVTESRTFRLTETRKSWRQVAHSGKGIFGDAGTLKKEGTGLVGNREERSRGHEGVFAWSNTKRSRLQKKKRLKPRFSGDEILNKSTQKKCQKPADQTGFGREKRKTPTCCVTIRFKERLEESLAEGRSQGGGGRERDPRLRGLVGDGSHHAVPHLSVSMKKSHKTPMKEMQTHTKVGLETAWRRRIKPNAGEGGCA